MDADMSTPIARVHPRPMKRARRGAPDRRGREVPVVPHKPHRVKSAALARHLVAEHGYTSEVLTGASALYVSTIHSVDHQRMSDDPSGTVPELTGSAERLFTSALATAEELVVLDPGLVKQVTARWVEALHALAR